MIALGSGVFLGGCQLPGLMPRLALVNAVNKMIGVVGLNIAQPSFGVDAVQLGRPDQRVNCGCTFAIRVGTGEQVIMPSGSNAA